MGGKPLTPFEIMVAKTYDEKRSFNLAERYAALSKELEDIEYETIPESNLLQIISVLVKKDMRGKTILGLSREEVIDHWPKMESALKLSIDYIRSAYKIPASRLLPYSALLIPFTYFFHNHRRNPAGDRARFLEDFFWRVSLSGRYSQSQESRALQDVQRMDEILANRRPQYDWAVDTSPEFIEQNGYFSVTRSFIKTLLCLMARKEPLSFMSNVAVRLDNEWLQRANSKNYHHFFPKAWLKRQGVDDRRINHIANITLVDDYLNKREIQAQAPSIYVRSFQQENSRLEKALATHFIGKPEKFGIFDNDYDLFIRERCKRLSKELSKFILPADSDQLMTASPASDTVDIMSLEDSFEDN